MVKPIWLGALWGFLTGLIVSGIPVFIYVANAYVVWIIGILVLFGKIFANSIIEAESLSRSALAVLVPIVIATWVGPHLLDGYKEV